MLLAALALVAGLAVLWKAADAFVLGAARASLMLRLSPIVVGALVLGFGTSAPELLVSSLAAAQGSSDIAVGNIVGSNVANVTLVAGVAALVCGRLRVASTTLRREAPLATLAVLAIALAVQGPLPRWVGVLLLVGFAAAVVAIVLGSRVDDDPLGPEASGGAGELEATSGRREAIRTSLGLLGTAAGAQLVVYGARGLADQLGLEEGFVGLTVVAVGTSLPELVTAVQAARRGATHLVVGNLFGSNLFNSLGIGGVTVLIAPGPIDSGAVVGVGTIAMVVAALAAWYLMGTRRALVRWEAVLLLAGFLAIFPLLLR